MVGSYCCGWFWFSLCTADERDGPTLRVIKACNTFQLIKSMFFINPEPGRAPTRIRAKSLSASEIEVSWKALPWNTSKRRVLGYEVSQVFFLFPSTYLCVKVFTCMSKGMCVSVCVVVSMCMCVCMCVATNAVRSCSILLLMSVASSCTLGISDVIGCYV